MPKYEVNSEDPTLFERIQQCRSLGVDPKAMNATMAEVEEVMKHLDFPPVTQMRGPIKLFGVTIRILPPQGDPVWHNTQRYYSV